jgi:hypothetical protein
MTPMTNRQWHAFDLLRRARREAPDTDDGVFSTETFYDAEIGVAYVHWSTARALQRRGLVAFGPYDPDNGTSITLTERGLVGA